MHVNVTPEYRDQLHARLLNTTQRSVQYSLDIRCHPQPKSLVQFPPHDVTRPWDKPATQKSAESPRPVDGTTGYECPQGTYCPAGSSAPLGCPPGTYNPSKAMGSCTQCPSGYLCSANATAPAECPVYRYCPAGSWEGIPCPLGTHGARVSRITLSVRFYTYMNELSLTYFSCVQRHNIFITRWTQGSFEDLS